VSPHQGGERLLVVLSQKALQKPAIAQARAIATEHHSAQMLNQVSHETTSRSGKHRASTYVLRETSRRVDLFHPKGRLPASATLISINSANLRVNETKRFRAASSWAMIRERIARP
jgi:hypothetical protein